MDARMCDLLRVREVATCYARLGVPAWWICNFGGCASVLQPAREAVTWMRLLALLFMCIPSRRGYASAG